MISMRLAAAMPRRQHGDSRIKGMGCPIGEDQMTDTVEQISDLLHEAGETHHRVFRIVDGADDDWASWYAQWLIDLSELPEPAGCQAGPQRADLPARQPRQAIHGRGSQRTWELYYARQILRHFQPSSN